MNHLIYFQTKILLIYKDEDEKMSKLDSPNQKKFDSRILLITFL